MKSVLFAAASTAMFALAAPAFAGHHELGEDAKAWVEGCKAYQEQNGGESDCTCLAKTMMEDEEFATEMMSITGPESMETLSEATLEKIDSCPMEEMEEEAM